LALKQKSSSVRLLGIDPGIAATGWGVIEHEAGRSRLIGHGSIVTSASEAGHERLSQIHRALLEVIDEHHPEVAAIEELFGGINLKTALAVGQARGVAVLACAERGVTPHDYTPLRIKQAVVGYGRASKSQVQQMVKALLGLAKVPSPDHAADALAVAICHAHSMQSNSLLAAAQTPPVRRTGGPGFSAGGMS
jgi:crossover junction endodeoxyribonuclease RuvC